MGTWQPSEGHIRWTIAIEDYDMGDVPASDFKLQNGVFRHENISLKKVETQKPVKK